jgi:hypothetical protein
MDAVQDLPRPPDEVIGDACEKPARVCGTGRCLHAAEPIAAAAWAWTLVRTLESSDINKILNEDPSALAEHTAHSTALRAEDRRWPGPRSNASRVEFRCNRRPVKTIFDDSARAPMAP